MPSCTVNLKPRAKLDAATILPLIVTSVSAGSAATSPIFVVSGCGGGGVFVGGDGVLVAVGADVTVGGCGVAEAGIAVG